MSEPVSITDQIKSLAYRGYGYEDIRVKLGLTWRHDELIKEIVFKRKPQLVLIEGSQHATVR